MDKYTCRRCLKNFKSEYTYNRHINKKIPCEEINPVLSKKPKTKTPKTKTPKTKTPKTKTPKSNTKPKIKDKDNLKSKTETYVYFNNDPFFTDNNVVSRKINNENTNCNNNFIDNKSNSVNDNVDNNVDNNLNNNRNFKQDSFLDEMDDEEIERNLQVLLDFLTNEKESLRNEINKFRKNDSQTDEQLLEFVIQTVDEEHDLYKRICQYQMTDMYYKKILVEYKVSKITSQVENILTTSLETCCNKFFDDNEQKQEEQEIREETNEIQLSEKEKKERQKVIKKIETLFDKKFDAFLTKCKEDVFKQIQESIDDMVNNI